MAKLKEVALMAAAVFLLAAFCFSSAKATTGAYSYALPGYTATYDIVKMPSPDPGAINPMPIISWYMGLLPTPF
ncbi:MAG: hypothetical protein ACLQO7_09365 [Candidatus Bathyarchaeia archaeon]